MRGRERQETGSIAVMEAVLVGFVIVGGVLFVATQTEPTTTEPQSRALLAAAANDALHVLGELPATNAAYGSLLEEYVTEALQKDCTNLERKLDAYFPTGVTYNVYLENGEGSQIVVCENGDVDGEQITAFTLMSPHWTNVYLVANVSRVAGTVALNAVGAVTDATSNPLEVQGIIVRNSYIDEVSDVTLSFGNAHGVPFNAFEGIRYTGEVHPEYRDALGYTSGYDVPYTTNALWTDYLASAADLTQPVGEFEATHNLPIAQNTSTLYEVHPRYGAAASISQNLQEMEAANRFQTDKRDASLESDVTFSYSYDGLLTLAKPLRFSAGSITVYNPVGSEVALYPLVSVSGAKSYSIPKTALWGTYVARLELHFDELDAITGLPVGTIHVVNQIAYFNVNPPQWADLPDHISPVYRVTVTAGFEGWR